MSTNKEIHIKDTDSGIECFIIDRGRFFIVNKCLVFETNVIRIYDVDDMSYYKALLKKLERFNVFYPDNGGAIKINDIDKASTVAKIIVAANRYLINKGRLPFSKTNVEDILE